MLQNVSERFRFFFNDYTIKYYSPPRFVQKIMTHLKSKVWGAGELLIETGKQVDNLYFFNIGVAHLYARCTFAEQEYRF